MNRGVSFVFPSVPGILHGWIPEHRIAPIILYADSEIWRSMRRSTSLWLVLAVITTLAVFLFIAATWARTESGQVVAANWDAKLLILDAGAGKQARRIKVTVDTDTKLRINGIWTPIADLQTQVKTGDMITVRFARGSDRRAARIAK